MHKTLRIKVIRRKAKAPAQNIHIMPLHRQLLMLVRVNLKVIVVIIPLPRGKDRSGTCANTQDKQSLFCKQDCTLTPKEARRFPSLKHPSDQVPLNVPDASVKAPFPFGLPFRNAPS